ncbi:DNA-binding transcriptional regulator FrlR [Bacillus carboniphilus]|uniref:DNA-binding transcriptional regulator FrlR n=1 Tax=Bacillus carboniphilus TaxID=86663 RepID=A0ABN0VU15_9BACI
MYENINKKPMYQRIYDYIANKIEEKTYQVGDLLPSESELEQIFQASRTPVRQALKQLEMDGLIYRLQGKGSFVANFKPLGQWTTMTGFSDIYKEEWRKISARTIEATTIKSKFYSELLGVSSESDIIHLRRIRYYNGEPIIYLEHYINPFLPLEIFKNDPSFISIDQLLKDERDIEFFTIKEEINAVSASSKVAEILKINEGEPVLKNTRISLDQASTPVDITVNYFSSERWKYRIEFNKQ